MTSHPYAWKQARGVLGESFPEDVPAEELVNRARGQIESSRPTCGHCRDCKWWRDLQDWNVLATAQYGRCHVMASPDALAWSNGDPIETFHTFGCVQFEARESTE